VLSSVSTRGEVEGPLVTIGLTCFNAEETIARAVESALEQDWPHLEVVVVDDSSTDGSVAVIQEIIARQSRARIVRHGHNTGPAGARNTILAEAKGEFVAFFDDDDESFPLRISVQVNTLENYEKRTGAGLVACYASGVRYYPNGYIMDIPAIGSRGNEAPNGSEIADYLLLYRKRKERFYGAGVPACALMARRSTFEAVNGFDIEIGKRVEDVDFAIRLAFKGGHFIGTTEKLFVQHASVGIDKSPERNLYAEQQLAKKNKAYLHAIGRYYYALHWPKLRYWHFKRRYGRFCLELLGLIFRNPFAVSARLLKTGPRRLVHEKRMQRKDEA